MSEQHAAPGRPQPRRGASGGWTRLKPMNIDPLEVYGLPSKGETRLHDHKIQESYFTKIVDRYMKFCASSGGGKELEDAFASLSLQQSTPPIQSWSQAHQGGQESSRPQSAAFQTGQTGSESDTRPQLSHRPSATERPNDLPNILMAMRKLREGIFGSRRCDAFAQRAYMFIIQASILARQWESYQPALRHLLYVIHPQTPLSSLELRDFVGYLLLDLACRKHEHVEAHAMKLAFQHSDRRTATVLKALIRHDWPRYWRIKRAVDGYQRALMEFAEEEMRLHALKCLGRSYVSADRIYIERCTGAKWHELIKLGVAWEPQANGSVVIRKLKPK